MRTWTHTLAAASSLLAFLICSCSHPTAAGDTLASSPLNGEAVDENIYETVATELAVSEASPAPAPVVVNPWTELKAPTGAKKPRAIGTNSAGCLDGAVALPADGPGFQVMRLSRGRRYGHPVLVKYLKNLGAKAKRQGFGKILVGDLGQARGGPMLTGHASHQNGLDVDLWFIPSKGAYNRKLTKKEREEMSAVKMVRADRSLIPGFFKAGNAKLLKAAASFPEVDRIFVDPAIKKKLCTTEKNKAWLRKIRPWWWHADHLHVRLKCPRGQALCEQTVALPPGDGCNADLDWWFTAEADQKRRELESRVGPRQMPKLPAACEALLPTPAPVPAAAPNPTSVPVPASAPIPASASTN